MAEFWDFDSQVAADSVKFMHTHLLLVVKSWNFCYNYVTNCKERLRLE